MSQTGGPDVVRLQSDAESTDQEAIDMMDENPSTLVRDARVADQAAKAKRYRGATEIELRQAVETWGRERWPDARVCHELVMDRGNVRLDVAFVRPSRLIVVELKSGYDTMERAIHQVSVARLAAHEVWLITDRRHGHDVRMVKFLLPSIGTAHGETVGMENTLRIKVAEEPAPQAPHPEALASVLWVEELRAALRWGGTRAPPHITLVRAMAALPPRERDALVCRELRARKALWRADPPISREPDYV